MTYEKIALVIIFLGVLIAAQFYLYTRHRSNPKMQTSIKGLKVISRLNLSKNNQLNIVNAGKESFLIVCSNNSEAARLLGIDIKQYRNYLSKFGYSIKTWERK